MVQKQKYFEVAQYFFNFDLHLNGTGQASKIGDTLREAGISGLVDYVAIPLSVGKILLRLENLSEETNKVDLDKVFHAINPIS